MSMIQIEIFLLRRGAQSAREGDAPKKKRRVAKGKTPAKKSDVGKQRVVGFFATGAGESPTPT